MSLDWQLPTYRFDLQNLPDPNKLTLVGFSGELASMLSLILIKSAIFNNENPPHTILNRFYKPYSVEKKIVTEIPQLEYEI